MDQPKPKTSLLRRKAPHLIAAAVLVAVAVYVLFVLLEDALIKGTPLTSVPLISAILSFTRNVTGTVSSLGYIGVFSLMILEASSVPIPSEIILPFAGYLVFTGHLDFWVTLIVATVAALVGSLIDYYIGRKGIETLLKHKILGRSFLSMDQLAVAAKWFNKYGCIMVFAARLIPVVRTLISFPAGAVKMPLAKFIAYTTVGCLLWNIVLIYVGYYLGVNWKEVADASHYIILGVVAVFVVCVIAYWVIRRRRKSQKVAIDKKIEGDEQVD